MTPEEMENAFERLFAAQDLLTGKVLDLTESVETMREQAEADRALQYEAIGEMRGAMGEMRTAVGAMLDVAESMAANVTVLTQMQQITSRRVDRLEADDPDGE